MRIYRKDYQPSNYLINNTNLIFELNKDFAIVKSSIDFYQNSDDNSLFLNGENLELLAINYKDYKITTNGLWLYNLSKKFNLKITTKIYPHKNTALSGLYISNNIFCTQCEAEGFRNITYYLDRPDVLSKWQVEIFANYSVLLSNGNLTNKTNNYAKWLDPFPKPCYLFALVAGNLAAKTDKFITKSTKEIKLKIFTKLHNIDKTDFAMLSLKNAFAWDEKRFNLEYDLNNYNIVAIDDFNSGAMENKSLNIFNSNFILANKQTATDKNYLAIESVIGHEYFHNWTGNRVTCRDWFQLSLKEGLTVFRDQEFSSDLRKRSIKRIEDVQYLRTFQFLEDNSPLKHPVRPESYIQMNNFYTLTVYEKGSEIIRMLHTILGEDDFLKMIAKYIKKFDGKAVTIEDFIKCANLQEFDKFMLWYQKAGTPKVKIINHHNKITFKRDDNRLLPIKYGVFNNLGEEIEDGMLLLNKKEQNFDFSHLGKNLHFSWLRDFSAPIILKDDLDLKQSVFLVKNDNNAFVRFNHIQKLYQVAILDNDENIFNALDVLISNNLDNANLAKLLQTPSEKQLHALVDEIDIQNIHQKLENFILKLATKYHKFFIDKYKNLVGNYSFNTKAIYARELKNICLFYLSKNQNYDLAYTQFNHANCMTDKLAAFKILLTNKKYYHQISDGFYQKYKNDKLVVNKWFEALASTKITTSKNIKNLLSHSDFNLKNPNKVRALIGGFCNNFINFHTPNGYQLLTNIIIKLNVINPQIASKLVVNLTNFKHYTYQYKIEQKQQLERILQTKNLSNNLLEIISYALQDN